MFEKCDSLNKQKSEGRFFRSFFQQVLRQNASFLSTGKRIFAYFKANTENKDSSKKHTKDF